MKVAIIGSRVYPQEKASNIARAVAGLPDGTILVSGGARGVDQIAESCHKGRIFSFRIYEENDHYGVEFWDTGGENPKVSRFDCYFADAKSALVYRDFLIAHECDNMIAFWNGYSKGTQLTATFVEDLGKEVEYL